jgi:hypothetical protein
MTRREVAGDDLLQRGDGEIDVAGRCNSRS